MCVVVCIVRIRQSLAMSDMVYYMLEKLKEQEKTILSLKTLTAMYEMQNNQKRHQKNENQIIRMQQINERQ